MANLGKPTGDVPLAGAKLDGFVRIAPVRHTRRVPVYVFDSLWDTGSAEMWWPLVKALEQFGSWSGLKPGATNSPVAPPVVDSKGKVMKSPPLFTFNLSHARYHSRYLVLSHRVVQIYKYSPLKRLSSREERLFQRVVHLHSPSYGIGTLRPTKYPLPAVVIGGYARPGPVEDPFVLEGWKDIQDKFHFYTFDGIGGAMRAGDWSRNSGFWVQEFNVYANTVAALVCSQDGYRPATVCKRPSIRAILTQK